jgi:protoporphyrinogen oxidase
MARIVVIGAGPMGLAAAYYATKAGHKVDLVEADDRPGGMAAHFDFDDLSIERFYHFVCKADEPMFALMREIGLGGAMRWRPTSMGYFTEGQLYPWGDPVALMAYPKLDLVSKVRYGLQMFTSTRRGDWSKLDTLTAKQWFVAWGGQRAWDALWDRLFTLKFYEYTDKVSAAWIWTRIKRVGTSRRSLRQEELGYVEGGSETLMNALAEAIRKGGGRVHLSTPARRVRVEQGRAVGVEAGDRFFPADRVISTVPAPLVPRLVPDLPDEHRRRFEALVNIGVVCVLHKLKRNVTPHFWVNIVDPGIDIPGIVEFSNLRPLPHTIVYVPYYMPVTNEKWSRPDQSFIDESFAYLKRLNPGLADADRLGSYVGRLTHAQPICGPRFLETLPPVDLMPGLKAADTSYYYPEDRGVSESVRFAKLMVDALPADGERSKAAA